jgi:two-component system, chemotaxis family, chemotaxis protein CheY
MSKTILIADDSPSLRQMISLTLSGAGYTVIEAVDGLDALNKSENRDIGLVITDLNMPRLSGLDLIRRLRAGALHRFTPALMLTTESDPAKKQEARAAGATGWIVKPFNPTQLLTVIKKVFA